MPSPLFSPPLLDSSLLPMEDRDIQDPVGEEVQFVARARQHIWQAVALLEGALLLVVIPGMVFLAFRAATPTTRWYRITEVGQVQAIQYNDLNYSPQTVEARRHLENWARYSYAREQGTVLQTYRRRFYFMSGDLVTATRQKDDKEQIIAQIAAGRAPGNKITDVSISFTSFRTRGSLAKGTAEIHFTKFFDAPTLAPQHFQATVTFEIDPTRVPEIATNMMPEYQEVNPIGLMITFADERQIQ
jgi:hypothetical protein